MTAYAWDQAADGSYTIRSVPIFELGEHRGFRYDVAWARRALSAFARLKSAHGYLPPVVLGHTSEESQEKPAVGFVDRLRLVGSRIVADLVGIGRDLFEQIRAGRWPYRSVEVFDRDAQITALALLGGTPPYMKTEPLHFAEDGSASVWIGGGSRLEVSPRLEETRRHDGGAMEEKEVRKFDLAGSAGAGEVDELIEAARVEERTKADERIQAAEEKFQAVEGKLRQATEQLGRLEAEARITEEKFRAAAERRRAAETSAFRAELRGHGYSPAIVDAPEVGALVERLIGDEEPVRFDVAGADGVAPLALFGRVLRLVAERAAQGTAFVGTDERATSSRFRALDDPMMDEAARFDRAGGAVDPASIRRYARARELAKGEGIAFREALKRVMEEE